MNLVRIFFFEDYRNERRNDLSLIGKNIPLLVRRRIDLCFNFHCKIRKNFVRIFFFSFWRRLRGWWKESIFFPSIEIPFGEDYEDEEKNRFFQLRYFAFFYRKFRKIFFFLFLLKITRTIKNWSFLQFRYSASFVSLRYRKFRSKIFFFWRRWGDDEKIVFSSSTRLSSFFF